MGDPVFELYLKFLSETDKKLLSEIESSTRVCMDFLTKGVEKGKVDVDEIRDSAYTLTKEVIESTEKMLEYIVSVYHEYVERYANSATDNTSDSKSVDEISPDWALHSMISY